METDSGSGHGETLDYDGVVRTTGSIEPWKIAAILALKPTEAELERAVAWVSVEEGSSGLRHESAGDAAAEARVTGIYEILVADRAEPDA